MAANCCWATSSPCVDRVSSIPPNPRSPCTINNKLFAAGERHCYSKERQLSCVPVLEERLEKRNLSWKHKSDSHFSQGNRKRRQRRPPRGKWLSRSFWSEGHCLTYGAALLCHLFDSSCYRTSHLLAHKTRESSFPCKLRRYVNGKGWWLPLAGWCPPI